MLENVKPISIEVADFDLWSVVFYSPGTSGRTSAH
jgi:hypothetical protein